MHGKKGINLKQYDSVQDYINDIQQYIYWKRARGIATKELELHIQDQKEALMEQGVAECEALRSAINTMGSAEKIGSELNLAYRPKVNLPLIGLTFAFIIIGILITCLTDAEFPITKGIAILVGAILAFLLYWFDYTVLIRFPQIFYFVHLLVVAIVFAFEARNGLSLISYNYTTYVLLLFPITLTGVTLNLRSKKETSLRLLYFALYAVVPLICAFLVSSIPTIALLIVTDFVIVIYGIKKKWFTFSFSSIISLLCLALFVATLLYGLDFLLNINLGNSSRSTEFIQSVIREKIGQTSFFGERSFVIQNDIDQLIMTDYSITVLLLKYGYFSVVIVAALFGLLLFLFNKIITRQKTDIGYLTSLIITVIISFQFICAILCNFGITYYFTMCLPFIISRGMFMVYNFILIGIILSVSRNEDIAQNWISYKERSGIYVY